MHKGDTVPGLLVALFGFSVAGYTFMDTSMTFSAQSSDGVPGAGFFPILLGMAVGILGVLLLIRGVRANGSVQYFNLDPEVVGNLKRLGLSVLGVVVFFILWRVSRQFIICVPILCLYLNFLYGRKWKFNILYCVIFTVFLYLAFVVGFKIQFNM